MQTHTIEPMTIPTSDMSSSNSDEDNSDVILDQRPLCCVCFEGKQQCYFIPEDKQRPVNDAPNNYVKPAINAQFSVPLLEIAYKFSLRLYPFLVLFSLLIYHLDYIHNFRISFSSGMSFLRSFIFTSKV